MQFLVLGRDGNDSEASARRQKVREDHLCGMRELKAKGNFVFGGALLDERGNMIGSAIVFDFPDRTTLDLWIARDPYVTGKVWQHIDVQPFRAAKVD